MARYIVIAFGITALIVGLIVISRAQNNINVSPGYDVFDGRN